MSTENIYNFKLTAKEEKRLTKDIQEIQNVYDKLINKKISRFSKPLDSEDFIAIEVYSHMLLVAATNSLHHNWRLNAIDIYSRKHSL